MDLLQLVISGLANGSVYGLIALGFVLIYKATEAVNFAQGDFMMLGAFIIIWLTNPQYLGINFWIAVPITILIMGVLGYLLDALVIRRLFGQPQISVVILTIALGFVIRFAAGVIWGHEPQLLQTPFAGRELRLGNLVLGFEEVAVILVTLILTLSLYLFFRRAKLGKAMQAASQNQLGAYYVGIPVKRIQSLVWALAGMVAAVAGVLFASKGAIDPSTGLLGIKAFSAAVIGGFGSLPGALIGGLIIGLVEPFASYALPSGYSQISPYAIMLLVLIFKPSGLFSQMQNKKV
ncbi:High-affinity branched-chain amino acid transport system permease protein LivH (TC 3.A.1.4.1) [hydrothermal vent metagenome]|uniref:High-affinity branched-chain amino acid transport system permease protein LivH (TC 3.A.1.4.1) n=1 Tax=hydrothermal vent metagenome TaxID=652676 RepID=A0A3B0UDN5_9ZZZZ